MAPEKPVLTKKELRQKMRKLRDGLDAEDKKNQDQAIVHKLHQLIEKKLPKTVHCYLPMGSEVDIYPLIEWMLGAGIEVISPRSLPKRKLEHLVLKSTHELEDGIFGTKHPARSHAFTGNYDIILIPGLAFDRAGNRLGYGAGYYDSFLKEHQPAYKIGVAYAFQILDEIPAEAHDVPLDEIIC